MTTVPNDPPRFWSQRRRIAIIGEAPGADEVKEGHPFVGQSGRLLWQVASKYGITREQCFVGNVCQVQPPNNRIEAFPWGGPEITDGLQQLRSQLADYKPNLCVLLGNTPLRAFTGETGITNWRGSLFRGCLGQTYKCLAALHPAAILRDYTGYPLLHFDLQRAATEGETATLALPQRNLVIDLSCDDILQRLDELCRAKPTIAIDIEGYWNAISCISIATSSTDAFIVPFVGWDQHDECRIILGLSQVLADPSIPKILQNSLYDTFCLQYGYKIPVRGVVDDTMLKHWELYCELPKSLAFQCSIYTREPYYKEERHSEDRKTLYTYCCRDAAVTYEINSVLTQQLNKSSNEHYRLNMALLEPLLYMELKGINYDTQKAQEKLKECTYQIHRLQACLNQVAGKDTPSNREDWIPVVRDTLCFKRDTNAVTRIDDILPHTKTTCLHLATDAVSLLRKDHLGLAENGALSILTETALNVESRDQLADFLYHQLGLPIQYKKEHGKTTTKVTTDIIALLTLYKKTRDPTLKLILKIRSLRTRCENLEARTDGDGRIRCGYNIVGTETGRLSCYESPTGSGFSLHTATKKDRDLFLPNPGYWLFQCDLSGADGWTVAAHCYALGDPTMLDDLRYGLKPAKIIALLYEHGAQVLRWSRDEIKSRSREVDPDGWLYFASKRVFHSSDYGVGSTTGTGQILKDSYKLFGEPIYVETSTFERLQTFFFTRYPGVKRWQAKCGANLLQTGYLISANGHKRIFHGRKKDVYGRVNNETLKYYLADEPQNNTTYATNLALYKLWTDPENRISGLITQDSNEAVQVDRQVSLRIQPLHQIHDAIVGQFRKDDTEWAVPRIRSYFQNELVIAGQRIIIPFEGAYGESWGNLKEGTI